MDGIVEAKKAAPTRDEPKRLQFFLDWTQNWTQLRNLLRSPPLLSRCYLNRPGGNRTCNPRFWRPVLYQLSYGPKNCCGWKLQNPGRPWKPQRWTRRRWRPMLNQLSHGPRNCCGWKLQNPERLWKARCLPLACRYRTASPPPQRGRPRR